MRLRSPIGARPPILFLLSGMLLLSIPRANLRLIGWRRDGWQETAPMVTGPAERIRAADLDGDGTTEDLLPSEGSVSVAREGRVIWISPESWDVADAEIADLNRDGAPEVVLLVWRPFTPWPVDAFQPHGGRISSFHDGANRSCHIILWGWAGDRYRELWAGSALSEPILAFAAADWNGDGYAELAAVETDYSDPTRGNALSLWEWNGFGFSLVQRLSQSMAGFAFVSGEDGRPSLLAEE
jgi:hypothetical protein